jgi:tape measure domain-containing protein
VATLAELNVRIAANIDDFERAMEQAERGVGRLGDRLQSAGRALSIGITVPLGLLAGAAINAYGKLESLGKGLDAIARQELSDKGVTGIAAIGQAATQTSARLKELEQLAKAPGIGFEQAVKGDIRLRAVGFTAEQSAAALREFANAIATTGGSASDLDGVTVQLAQLSAKGKVLAQDLRPIIERAPILASVLKKLYNTVDSETISKSLEKQGKNSQDFINEITVQLGKLPRVTGGIANQFENLGQTATQSLAKLGESFSKAINLPAIVEGISNGIERLTAAFTSLSPGTQKLIFGLAGAAAAVGPVLLAVGTLGAALPAITAGFSVLGITSVAALGPIGLAAAGVAAAAFLIIDHWDELVAYFGPLGEGGRLFSDLSDSISQSAGEIGNALASINTGGDNFGDLISATGIFKDLFSSLTVGITAFSDYFGGVIGTVTRLLQGDLTGAAEQATRVLYGLIDPIANLLGFTKKAAAGGGDGLGYFGDQALRAASGLGFLNQQLTGFAGGLPQQDKVVFAQIGLLEELRAKLKAVKEQRETETSTAAIAADNKLVDSYQKQIDALLGVEKRTRKQKDALAELRKELANVDTYAKIFSTPAEGAQIAAQKIELD